MKTAIATEQTPQDLRDGKRLIAGFIDAQVVRRGLDWRTGEAYRIDLEHFYKWLDGEGAREAGRDLVRETGRDPAREAVGDPVAGVGQELQQPQPQLQTAGGLPQDGRGWQEKMEAYLEYLALVKKLRPSTVARKYRVFNYYLAYLVREGLLRDCGPLKLRRAAGRPRRRGWDGDGLQSADLQRGTDGLGHADVWRDADKLQGRSPDGQKGAEDSGDAGGPGDALDSKTWSGRRDADRIDRYEPKAERMSKTDVDAFFLALEREYSGLESDFRKRVCLRDLVMMELLFYHGIEVTELLRLEISDYDRKTGVLTVPKKRGKTESIYLYSRALRERMELWIREHGEFERVAEYKGRMFLSKLGRPLSMKMVINIFEKYRVLAGIEKEVTPKDLKGCMGEYARELMREWCG